MQSAGPGVNGRACLLGSMQYYVHVLCGLCRVNVRSITSVMESRFLWSLLGLSSGPGESVGGCGFWWAMITRV